MWLQSLAARHLKVFKEYHSARFHFSIFYPEELEVKKSPVGQTLTVTFDTTHEDAKGFEIFVQAYNLPKITNKRFLKDAPSGVQKNPQAVTISCVSGEAFYSTDANLGDTHEVWFLNKGLLYEASTPKPLEAWFREILQTWQFI